MSGAAWQMAPNSRKLATTWDKKAWIQCGRVRPISSPTAATRPAFSKTPTKSGTWLQETVKDSNNCSFIAVTSQE